MFKLPIDQYVSTRRSSVGQVLRAIAIVSVLSGLAAAQAFAAGADLPAEGTVTFYTRSGGVIEKKVSDDKMLNELLKDASAIPEEAIMMHNGHWYLLKDHKMTSGAMVFDMLSGH